MYRKISLWISLLLVLITAVSACGGQISATAEPTPGAAVTEPGVGAQPAAGQIAFISDRGGQVDVWLMDTAGSSPRQLTSDPDRESSVQWSPNGRKLLYTASNDSGVSVFTLNTENGTKKKVFTSTESLEAVWSASSDAVLVQSTAAVGETSPGIFLVSLDRDETRQIVAGDGNRLGSLSAGTGKMAVEVQTEETAGVFVGNPDARSVTSADAASLIEGTRPIISPDGRTLASFSPPMDDDPALYVRNLASGQDTALNADNVARRWDHGVVWAPDSKRLAFVRSTVTWIDQAGRPVPAVEEGQAIQGDEGIRVAVADGGSPKRITDNSTDTSPAWSPDGGSIAFVSARDKADNSDIWVVSAAGEGLKNLTKGSGNSWSPTWGVAK